MKRLRLVHFDIPTYGNYGDTLLFEAVRQTFEGFADGACFEVRETHPLREPVGPRLVDRINATADAVVVGGGGLFLSDTNPNRRSGWQWNISIEQLRRLQVPIILFAVGNNRFYGQADFADPFREHLALTAEKSVFFGLRNHGSVRTIREYLPPSLAERVTYQPCPTTISSALFPDLFREELPARRLLAAQSIVGKRQRAAGFDPERIYRDEARALARLAGDGWEVRSMPFARADLGFQEVLAEAGVPTTETRLYGRRELLFGGLRELSDVPLVLGTRGHAQMVPFGMGGVPLSLDVHPKTGYFAQDVGHPEWVLDPRADDFSDAVYRAVHEAHERHDELRADTARVRERLLGTTLDNLAGIYRDLTGTPVTPSLRAATPRERAVAERAYDDALRRTAAEQRAAAARTDAERERVERLVARAVHEARAGDYATARTLRRAAGVLDPAALGPAPAWDAGAGRLVPPSVLRAARRLRGR